MAVATVASRYAKSLLDLAKEQNVLDAMHTDMLFFRDTLAQNRQLALILKNPIVRAEKKNAIVEQVFAKRFSPLTMAFFKIIANKNREAIIGAIADEFIAQYDRLKGVDRATIITTVPLTEEQRTIFKNMVSKAMGGKSVALDEKIDSSLIGGYVLRMGDRQVDGSIRNQLSEMKLKFLNN
ncbi:ATP synthase F1 subunit delta [Spirosoma luteolum]